MVAKPYDAEGQAGLPIEGIIDREKIFASLERLRKGLLQTILIFVVLAVAIFPFSKQLLRQLYETNLKVDLVAEPHAKVSLTAFTIPEAFFSLLKLTLYASLFLSIPIIFYQAWKAFAPLLRLKGIKSAPPFLVTAIFLFYLGAFFCFFVTLPFGVQFLVGYQSAHLKPMISVGTYVSFCTAFIFSFGLTFELPLILALLSYIKIVNAAFLTRNRRYAILIIAAIAAVITPTPDVFNMALMGVPLYVLFEVGVIVVKLIERKRARAEIAFPTR
ncbi:MAG: twin-arginine translocase subunit TatC [Desulfobacterales bacterium]|nr:twin-arginine translocase subunit TatC [Desulfobacterales bacterium]